MNKPTVRLFALQIVGGGRLDGFGGDLLDAVAVQEIKAPIALRGPFAERDGDLAGVRRGHFARLENLLPGAVDFLGAHAVGADGFSRAEHEFRGPRPANCPAGLRRRSNIDRGRARRWRKRRRVAAFLVSTSAL